MKRIQLTIVIPTYNESKDIFNCLSAIEMQDFPKNEFEVIIVDNYSTDNTLEIAKTFSKKINLKILKNKIKDAEVSKKIGFDNARGEFFMYLDADMKFVGKEFISKMLFPFSDDKRIAGNFVRFLPNKKQPPLTRTLSYDAFQRDPIFQFFTYGVESAIIENKEKYFLCKCDKDRILPQGLMIYRRKLIFDYIKDKKQLIDNEIPAVLVEEGHQYFAYVPSTGVEHMLLRSLKELWKKRVRNLERTYYPNYSSRKFRWIRWKKDWPKIGIWLIYTHSLLPIFNSIIKTIKYKDICFLSEPVLNAVSTYSIIYGVLKKK